MTLYDEVLKQIQTLINSYPQTAYSYNPSELWPDAGRNNFVLAPDMAYELGGSTKQLKALGSTVLTSSKDFVEKDETVLIGSEIALLTEDTPYARLSFCLVEKDSLGQGEDLFNMVKAINYTRYHFNPEGFMMRISATNKRESVRISKEAVAKGLTFEKAGNLLIKEFHKNQKIKAVRNIFINLKDFDFASLEEYVKKVELITKAIDHISESSLMNCHTCGLKKICDEVEGMRELHFGKAEESK